MPICRLALLVDRRLVLGFAAVMLIGAKPTYGDNGAVAVVRPVRGIIVDGDLADWPKDVVTYPVASYDYGDKPGSKEDLSAQFRIGYNAGEHAIYVAVEVQDNSSILDDSPTARWDSQDGCEIYVQAKISSPVVQYCRLGNKNQIYGTDTEANAQADKEQGLKVAVARTDSKVVYEWRLELGKEVASGRALAFDVSVADKDKDGTFSWAAWGPGTNKLGSPDRCGTILLVDPDTRFGEVSGRIAWKDASPATLPARVLIESTRSAGLQMEAKVDSTGAYQARLPVGPYTVHAVDSVGARVEEKPHVDVAIEADKVLKADLLHVTPVPSPGLIGEEGVLRRPGAFDADEMDRFVNAYLSYFKIPGISIAVIKDGKVVYNRGLGVKNAATREKVAVATVFEAASMTKPMLGFLVLRLMERGVIALDTPLYTYLPYEDIAYDDRYKLITARMVLTHRTGFPNWRTGKLDLKFTPGTKASYSGEGFVYLGKVVEHLTGKKLVELCREEVFKPMEMENAYLMWDERVGQLTATGHNGILPLSKWKPDRPNMASSLHVDAGTYAKFLIGIIEGTGLSEATFNEMLRAQSTIPEQNDTSFGLGIATKETPQGIFYGHGGRNTGFTSVSAVYKDQKVGYVFLVNNEENERFDDVLNAYLIGGKAGLKSKTK
jgi:CubicO group peptidase (beta-lactamase class C family)